MKILYRLIFAKVNSRFFSDPNTLSPGFIHLRPFLWYFTSWVTGSYGRATDGTLNFFCLFRETQEKKTQQKSSSVLGWSPDCWKDHFPAFLQQGDGSCLDDRVWTKGIQGGPRGPCRLCAQPSLPWLLSSWQEWGKCVSAAGYGRHQSAEEGRAAVQKSLGVNTTDLHLRLGPARKKYKASYLT